jgi:hypothetical protein
MVKADHTLVVPAATTDPIHQSSLQSDSEGSREVYMVGHREELSKKTIKEIQQEADEKIARAARLAKDAEKGKSHNDLQDDSSVLNDEPRDDAPSR